MVYMTRRWAIAVTKQRKKSDGKREERLFRSRFVSRLCFVTMEVHKRAFSSL